MARAALAVASGTFLSTLLQLTSMQMFVVVALLVSAGLLALYTLMTRRLLADWRRLSRPLQRILAVTSLAIAFLVAMSLPRLHLAPPISKTIVLNAAGVPGVGKGTEVWLIELRTGRNTVRPETMTVVSGQWKDLDGLRFATGPAVLSWEGLVGDHVEMVFVSHPSSGTAHIDVEGRTVDVDLYHPTGTSRAVALPIVFSVQQRLVTELARVGVAGLLASFLIAIAIWAHRPSGRAVARITKPLWFAAHCGAMVVPIVVLLAVFPGLMTSDSLDQWRQAASLRIASAHPPFHTLTIAVVQRIWTSPAAMVLLQMLAFTIIIGVSVRHASRYAASKHVVWIIVAAMAYPPIVMFSAVVWKDILFAAAFLGLVVCCSRAALDDDLPPAFLWWLGLAVAGTTLYRHNGLFAVAAAIVGFLITVRASRMRVCLVAGSVLVVCLGGLSTYDRVMQARMPAYAALIPPLHQVGRAVATGYPFSEEERRTLFAVLPESAWMSGYDPYSINGLVHNKAFKDSALREHRAEFIRTWLRLVVKAPGIVLGHIAGVTSMIWSVGQPPGAYLATVPRGIDTNDQGLVSSSGWQDARDALWLAIDATEGPRTRWLFWRPATWLMASLFLSIIAATRRGRRYLLVQAPSLGLVGSYVLSIPSQDSRYLLPVLMTVPMFALMAFAKGGDRPAQRDEASAVPAMS